MFTSDSILNLADDVTDGFIFEVDLEYPQELHDSHNQYPLAPEKLEITQQIWSLYDRKLGANSRVKKSTKLTRHG